MHRSSWNILFVLCSLKSYNSLDTRNFKMHLDKTFAVCPGMENMQIQFDHVGIYMEKDDFIINMDLLCFQNFYNPVLVHLTAEKCPSKEKLDSCMKYVDTKAPDHCAMITQSMAKNCVNPPLKCPYKKGVYSFRNCTMSKLLLNFVPASSRTDYWKVRILLMKSNSGEVLGCGDLAGQLRFIKPS